MTATRREVDSFGAVDVPVDALWGPQTARSLRFFAIGTQRMPLEVVHAIAWIKWAAAGANRELQGLDPARAEAIAQAAQWVAEGRVDEAFPLSAWQTGSGTQSHMNVNEVIAGLASHALGAFPAGADRADSATGSAGSVGTARPVDAHDEVNLGQSTNDVFPSAVHIAVALQARDELLPALAVLHTALADRAAAFEGIVKVGRTHLQDATPLTLGQEFSGYAAQLATCGQHLRHALHGVHALALGGTAVGTGLNTHPEFGARVAEALAERLALPLVQAENLFAAVAGQESLVAWHGQLRLLAVVLAKVAGDIRLMGSGPRAGLGELRLPQNEPGSSIMPGKVNPTQVEALTMVCAQVMGHDATIGFAASQGQLELNAFQPLIALDTLDSQRMLADAMRSFATHCVAGLQVDATRVARLLDESLMLVTALVPHIGYDRAARIAQDAERNGLTLREATLSQGAATAEDFDTWVDPHKMLGPRPR
ncbi:lyase family protein [Ideonella sp. A 288]|uniref:class II fumarate hydratase n=1 Tax=Ideonella sp. A 288 TaxID=1962181 RepID=UPI000B4BAF69|nr:class II fumarate hydratase [Ideonella sp. A 288]